MFAHHIIASVRVREGNGKSTSLLPSNKVAQCLKPQFLRQSSPSTEKTRPLAAAGDGTAQALYWQSSQGDSAYQQNVGPGHDNVQVIHIKIFTTEMYRASEPGSEIFFSFQFLLELGGVSFVMIPFNIEWLVLWTVRAVNEISREFSQSPYWDTFQKGCLNIVRPTANCTAYLQC